MHDLVPKLNVFWVVVPASPHQNQGRRAVHMLWVFFRHFRRAKWVIIDTYSTRNFYFAWGLALLCRLFNKTYWPILHGGNLPARLRDSPRLSRQIFGHAAVNIAPSGYLKKAFEQAGFKTTLIPNFIHIERYLYQNRAKIRPKLLWVRAFEQTYHPEMAIRVLAQIAQKHPDAQLCMVGADQDGSLAKCRVLAENLGVGNQVRFTGRLPKVKWLDLSKEYDVFLNTTHFDNTPVSVIEAMALGLPVVSTEVGGMPFLIQSGETGILTPDSDVLAMTDAVEKLLQNVDLATKISINARKMVEKWDWKELQQAWFTCLKTSE